MNDTFRYTLVPVILGANLRARQMADRFFRRFRVRSYVMNEVSHIALWLTPSLRFRKLSQSNGFTNFVLADLLRLTQETPDKLFVLIAATPHYRAWIEQHRHTLEPYYIISDPDLSFLSRENEGGTEHRSNGG